MRRFFNTTVGRTPWSARGPPDPPDGELINVPAGRRGRRPRTWGSAPLFSRTSILQFAVVFAFCLSASGEPADWIYSARYVVTMDAQHRLIDDGAVAVRGERIVGVGKRADIDKQFQAAHRLDRPEALLMPGLINTHTHAAMSLLRGIADDLHLQEWLEKYIFPAEAKNVTPDFVLWGTRLACLEMMLSGTTGTTFNRASFSVANCCQGTILAWCSSQVISISSSGPMCCRPQLCATRLMASVAPRTKTISFAEDAFRNPRTFSLACSYASVARAASSWAAR